MFQFDALEKAIRRRFARTVRDAIQDADQITLHAPRDHVSVPLQADVQVLWEQNLAAFAVQARLANHGPLGRVAYEGFFSTTQFNHVRDKAELLEFLLEEVKRSMLHKLAEGELEIMLKPKGDSPTREPE